jgi:hypothetical protein
MIYEDAQGFRVHRVVKLTQGKLAIWRYAVAVNPDGKFTRLSCNHFRTH